MMALSNTKAIYEVYLSIWMKISQGAKLSSQPRNYFESIQNTARSPGILRRNHAKGPTDISPTGPFKTLKQGGN
ncbi:hypothetical protein TH25_08195 [Thalassospira profundimaris]|uniref:Uncharacterized protein n=1 Tax=Thalassospira profundimaris TaxID=502049 RepID=A0A367XDB4_9PROT|nr:hypothetical protein [Thalassospira profundimaris]RCK51663.1 hypothetical protein TH25_08195 [Thalassospira profundimaris]